MRLLIVDDQPEVYATFVRALQRKYPDVGITYSDSALDAFQRLQDGQYDIVVLDQVMGGGEKDGIALLRRLAGREADNPVPQIIFVTGHYQEVPASAILATGLPIALFLLKDASFPEMLAVAIQLLRRRMEGVIRYDPRDLFGPSFMDLILHESDQVARRRLPGYLSIDQQWQISNLVRSFVSSLQTRSQWDVDDALELSIFFTEGLCRVFDLPENLVDVVRRFLNIEEILYTVPHYRDHFFHQIKVFLLGFCIVNGLNRHDELRGTVLADTEGMKTWFTTSAFHDIGYPFEKMTRWLNSFVEGMLRSPTDDDRRPIVPMTFHWGALLGHRYHAFHLRRIVERVCALYEKSSPQVVSEVLCHVSSSAVDSADHGLFSSLVVQNFLGGKVQDSEVVPAALAIALHNEEVATFVQRTVGHLTFERDPISFLLAFCDLAQDWGRTRPLGMSKSGYQEYGYPLFASDSVFDPETRVVRVILRYDLPMSPPMQARWRSDIYERHISPTRTRWAVGAAGNRLPGFCIEYRDGSGQLLEQLQF
jgi:CheY-like chemotaxis protein